LPDGIEHNLEPRVVLPLQFIEPRSQIAVRELRKTLESIATPSWVKA
jgi:hypothetical protein